MASPDSSSAAAFQTVLHYAAVASPSDLLHLGQCATYAVVVALPAVVVALPGVVVQDEGEGVMSKLLPRRMASVARVIDYCPSRSMPQAPFWPPSRKDNPRLSEPVSIRLATQRWR